ncbi:MAG: hypothetical protein IJE77_13890 [Thermoguttaceae bacterium]|nr:hypothetical protein [Thermoguttaceae bacterium]MBQ8286343.1 hypothetical protein [Thermoguttaceae bacterium]
MCERILQVFAVLATALFICGCAATRSTVETRAAYKPCSGEPEIEIVVQFEKTR